MKKILSERNFVVVLFVVAFVVFSFAQEDAKKIEKMYHHGDGTVNASSLIRSPKPTAGNIEEDKPVKAPAVK